jgi:hypothetical protein
MAKPMHDGSCHCGAVEFRFYGDISTAVKCNCSYCTRKAALHFRVPGACFELIQGRAALTSYRFGTQRATHFFCQVCGVHTHCHPRSAPDQVNVNLHCSESVQHQKIETTYFDGRVWDT